LAFSMRQHSQASDMSQAKGARSGKENGRERSPQEQILSKKRTGGIS
jgi:hypothetical protein